MINLIQILIFILFIVSVFYLYNVYFNKKNAKKFEEIYLFIYENFKDKHNLDLVNCVYSSNNIQEINKFFYMQGYTNNHYYNIKELYKIFIEFKKDKLFLKYLDSKDIQKNSDGLYTVSSKNVMIASKKERYILFSEKCKNPIIRNKAKNVLNSQFKIHLPLEQTSEKDVGIIENVNNELEEYNPLEKEVIEIISRYK